MNRTPLRLFAILGPWSCLATQVLVGAPAMAQALGTNATRTQFNMDVNDLFQHWVHSSEEEKPGGTIQAFRPAASMQFPPSRFRMAYKFARNGDCEFYHLSPDDAHDFRPCSWTISARDKMALQISANGKATSYRIVELSAKILRLAPLEQRSSR